MKLTSDQPRELETPPLLVWPSDSAGGRTGLIRAFITPPAFADEEMTRIAGLLHTILRSMVVVSILSFVLLFFLGPSRLLGFVITVFFCMLGIALLVLMFRGKIRLASLLFVSLLGLFGLTLAIYGGGVSGPAVSFFIVVILVAGLLLGGQGALVFMLLSLLANSALVFADSLQVLPEPLAPMTIAFQWVIYNVYLALAAVLLVLANQNIQSALTSARQKKEALSREIQERVEIEKQLKHYADELENSNDELKLFAHVASHDLQEPLRTISSYLQLLERKFQGQLDSDGLEYLQFAVDGSKRMQALLMDLREYALVNTKEQYFQTVDCNLIVSDIQKNLEKSISETGAQIELDVLPTVYGDPHQIGQLFQNLIANAIKYRRERPPVIKICAQPQNRHWLFTITDNGIGIAPQHQNRIFQMFQRLHTHEEFPGTGIGLATCKRITDRHGGQIWVDSVPGNGSIFYFTLPQAEKARP